MSDERRFYESPAVAGRRSAPAALRNRQPIADVLGEWLPDSGLVLEIASGTGEHVVHFAEAFPKLEWQPSDVDPIARESIRAWQATAALPNLRPPVEIDASSPLWPIDRADAVLSINMVHISPWGSAMGLVSGAGRLLGPGAPLILYGPWLSVSIQTAPSNLRFDSELKSRDPAWGLRRVEDFEQEAMSHGLLLVEKRSMPANNLMLLFRKATRFESL